jgi:hypothetical protein
MPVQAQQRLAAPAPMFWMHGLSASTTITARSIHEPTLPPECAHVRRVRPSEEASRRQSGVRGSAAATTAAVVPFQDQGSCLGWRGRPLTAVCQIVCDGQSFRLHSFLSYVFISSRAKLSARKLPLSASSTRTVDAARTVNDNSKEEGRGSPHGWRGGVRGFFPCPRLL